MCEVITGSPTSGRPWFDAGIVRARYQLDAVLYPTESAPLHDLIKTATTSANPTFLMLA